jgi:DNA-binding MarR family transcriptional regulator
LASGLIFARYLPDLFRFVRSDLDSFHFAQYIIGNEGVVVPEKTAIIDDVLVCLRQIMRATDIHSRKLMKECGLTVPQLILLKELRQIEPTTVGQIAKATHLSQGTVTQIIIRLEQRGYLTRTRDEVDRRKVKVCTTTKGRETMSDAPSLIHYRFASSFEQLKPWEQSLILSSLQRVAEMMNAEDLDVAPLLVADQFPVENDNQNDSPGIPQG